MDSAEIVEREPHSDRCPVVFKFLGKGVRQPGKPANAHSSTKVGPLHNAGTDALRIGTAHDWDRLHAGNFGGAIAGFAFGVGAVYLDELREVTTAGKRRGDRGSVRRETVSCDLKLAPRGVAQAFDKNIRGGLVALASRDVQHQLGMALDCDEYVAVPHVHHRTVLPAFVFCR